MQEWCSDRASHEVWRHNQPGKHRTFRKTTDSRVRVASSRSSECWDGAKRSDRDKTLRGGVGGGGKEFSDIAHILLSERVIIGQPLTKQYSLENPILTLKNQREKRESDYNLPIPKCICSGSIFSLV